VSLGEGKSATTRVLALLGNPHHYRTIGEGETAGMSDGFIPIGDFRSGEERQQKFVYDNDIGGRFGEKLIPFYMEAERD